MRKLIIPFILFLGACRIDARVYTDDGAPDASGVDAPQGTQQILVDGASTAMVAVEEGSSESVEVTLRYPPSGSLAVVIAADDEALATVDSPALTFDESNFDVPQLIAITGTQDTDDEPETTSVTLSAPDAEAATVDITVNDDESQAVLVSMDAANIVEGGSAQVSVTLRFPPDAPVTVAVSSDDPEVATATTTELMFTAANYDQGQDVTIVAAEDVNTVEDAATISMMLADATTGTVAVTVPDNDVLGFVVSTLNLTVNENGTGTNTFTVRLSNMPAETVLATVAPLAGGIYTLSPDTLTFNSVNWNDPQIVTVTALGDGDEVDEASQARVTATGVTTGTVNVTIEDTTQIVNFGWPTWFGEFVSFSNGILHAYRLTISGTTPVTLDKWGIISRGGGTAMARTAIYSNGTNGPGNLIASSGGFQIGVAAGSVSDVPFDVADTTSLSPGTYWLAMQISSTIEIGQSQPLADAYCNKTLAFGTALPAVWGLSNCFSHYQSNVYLVTYR